MTWIGSFYRSAIGKKAVMAVTGVFLFAWIVGHMLGNLKVFLGAEHLNTYAQWLRTMGAPAMPNSVLLWVVRVLMIVAIWLHIQAATQLTLMNRAARPAGYRVRGYEAASYASRTSAALAMLSFTPPTSVLCVIVCECSFSTTG